MVIIMSYLVSLLMYGQDSYIAYTSHIVEDSLPISSHVLSTVRLTEQRTIYNMKAHILQMLL